MPICTNMTHILFHYCKLPADKYKPNCPPEGWDEQLWDRQFKGYRELSELQRWWLVQSCHWDCFTKNNEHANVKTIAQNCSGIASDVLSLAPFLRTHILSFTSPEPGISRSVVELIGSKFVRRTAIPGFRIFQAFLWQWSSSPVFFLLSMGIKIGEWLSSWCTGTWFKSRGTILNLNPRIRFCFPGQLGGTECEYWHLNTCTCKIGCCIWLVY